MVQKMVLIEIGCTNDDPTKCLLFLGYGFIDDPDGGDDFQHMMTCWHCPSSVKTFDRSLGNLRRFGYPTNRPEPVQADSDKTFLEGI